MFTASTVNSAAAWRPDLFVLEPTAALPEAVILKYTTVAGKIEGDQPAVRVAFCIDDAADFVDEGAEIDEAAPQLSEALVYTRKFAQLLRISREQYYQNGTSAELGRSVERAMSARADHALLSQPAPVGPDTAPAAGLTQWPGLVSETVVDSIDPLIDLEAAVRANGANPTAWIMAPSCWAALRKLKTSEAAFTNLLGAGTENSEARLLSVPVLVNAQMPHGTGLLIDKSQVISAVSALEIATSADRYFNSDSIAIRATMRTGHTVPRPERLGVFTVDVEDGS